MAVTHSQPEARTSNSNFNRARICLTRKAACLSTRAACNFRKMHQMLELTVIRTTINSLAIYSRSRISSHHIVNTTTKPHTKLEGVEKTAETSSKIKVRNNPIRTEWELASVTTTDLDFA